MGASLLFLSLCVFKESREPSVNGYFANKCKLDVWHCYEEC